MTYIVVTSVSRTEPPSSLPIASFMRDGGQGEWSGARSDAREFATEDAAHEAIERIPFAYFRYANAARVVASDNPLDGYAWS